MDTIGTRDLFDAEGVARALRADDPEGVAVGLGVREARAVAALVGVRADARYAGALHADDGWRRFTGAVGRVQGDDELIALAGVDDASLDRHLAATRKARQRAGRGGARAGRPPDASALVAVRLHELAGLSVPEIAGVLVALGTERGDVGALKARLHKALGRSRPARFTTPIVPLRRSAVSAVVQPAADVEGRSGRDGRTRASR